MKHESFVGGATGGPPPTIIPSLDEHHYLPFFDEFNRGSCGAAIGFIIQRNLMQLKDRPKQIKMIINSPGGDVNSCFALVDCMKGSAVPVATFGLGLVASCGLITLIAGAKGQRYVTRNTSLLSHQFSWGAYGKEHELFSRVTEYENTSGRIMAHYKKCTGLPEKRIREILLPPEDVWLTATEAVKYGLADKIVDFY